MKKKPKLTLLEREKIYLWIHEAKSFREIGNLLGRSHTSIAREVKRNKNQNSGEYLACKADAKARKREKMNIDLRRTFRFISLFAAIRAVIELLFSIFISSSIERVDIIWVAVYILVALLFYVLSTLFVK